MSYLIWLAGFTPRFIESYSALLKAARIAATGN